MIPQDLLIRIMRTTPEQQEAIRRVLDGHPAPANGPLLVNLITAARLLGISRGTLWRLIRAGRLEKVELAPGIHRLRRADLEAIARGRFPGAPGPRTPAQQNTKSKEN